MPRRDRHTGERSAARGFTLLEVVVVLVIVGLTAGIAFPRLATMGASFEFASERDNFEQALNGLTYGSYRDNSDKVLLGTYTAAGRDVAKRAQAPTGTTIPLSLRTRSLIETTREQLPPVNAAPAELLLPEGWEVRVDNPIYFRGTGYCSGGTVELDVGRLQYVYELKPPFCRAELVE